MKQISLTAERQNQIHTNFQQVVGQLIKPVSGHAVLGFHHAEADSVGEGTFVALDPDATGREQDREALPGAEVPVGGLHLLDHDPVGIVEDLKAVPGDLPEAADCKAGAGEGLALDDISGQAELLVGI